MNDHVKEKIQSIFIFVNPRDIEEMKNDIWNHVPVSGRLIAGNKQYKIRLSYRGSHIREFPKKSYYASFVKPKIFLQGSACHFNSEYIDRSLIRNALSISFFSSIGVLSPNSEHISLTINGKYEGVYLMLESVDRYFLKNRFLPEGAIYYAIDDDANFSLISPFTKEVKEPLEQGYERKVGTQRDDEYLRQLIFHINTIPSKGFERKIIHYVDIDKYLRWLAGVVCTQNFDGFVHNYALYRNSETGRFEVIPWDYDGTWGRDVNGDEMEYDYIPIQGYNTLTARMLKTTSFREFHRKILRDIIDQQFTVQFLEPKIECLHRMLRPYVLRDPYRKDHMKEFDNEPALISKYIRDRNNYLRKHLSELE